MATFEGLLSAAPDIPIVILSSAENESVARRAVERGAHDYVVKSQLPNSRLRNSVQLIIDRYTAEEKAFLQQQFMELTLSSTGDAVLIADSAGRVTNLNPAAEKMVGWSRHEAHGLAISEVFFGGRQKWAG